MKVTVEIPDELYRRVKARSAMEGRPVRSVAVELFQKWLDPEAVIPQPSTQKKDLGEMPWLAITRPYHQEGMSHDLDKIREAISRSWSAEVGGKIKRPKK